METITKKGIDQNSFVASLQTMLASATREESRSMLRNMIRFERLDLAWRMTDDVNRQRRIAKLQNMCTSKIMSAA
jgi:hypothetical protein